MKYLLFLLLLTGLRGYSQNKDTITNYLPSVSEATRAYQIVYCDFTKLYAIRYVSDTNRYLGWTYSTIGNTVYKGLTLSVPLHYDDWNGVREANFKTIAQAQNLINVVHKLGSDIAHQDSVNIVSHIYHKVN